MSKITPQIDVYYNYICRNWSLSEKNVLSVKRQSIYAILRVCCKIKFANFVKLTRLDLMYRPIERWCLSAKWCESLDIWLMIERIKFVVGNLIRGRDVRSGGTHTVTLRHREMWTRFSPYESWNRRTKLAVIRTHIWILSRVKRIIESCYPNLFNVVGIIISTNMVGKLVYACKRISFSLEYNITRKKHISV